MTKRPRSFWVKWALALIVAMPLVYAALTNPLKLYCAASAFTGDAPKKCHTANLARDLDKIVEIEYFRHNAEDVVRLQVPEGFIDRWVTGPKIIGPKAAVYLHASGIKLVPESLDNGQDFKFPNAHAHEIAFELASLYRLTPDLVKERTEDVFQLHMQIDTAPCQYKPDEQQVHGLTRRVVDIESCPDTRDSPRDDIYYTKHPDGRLKSVLRCSAEEIQEPPADRLYDGVPTRVPRCKHLFFLPQMNGRVRLNYARLHLPQWQALEQAVTQRLLSLVPGRH